MLRLLQAVGCAAVVFVAGCNAEVKEVPPADKDTTPKVSPEEKQAMENALKGQVSKKKNGATDGKKK